MNVHSLLILDQSCYFTQSLCSKSGRSPPGGLLFPQRKAFELVGLGSINGIATILHRNFLILRSDLVKRMVLSGG